MWTIECELIKVQDELEDTKRNLKVAERALHLACTTPISAVHDVKSAILLFKQLALNQIIQEEKNAHMRDLLSHET
jgi:hypothetical protein